MPTGVTAATSPSPTLGQTEVLALRLRLEAVVIAAAAAIPEAGAFVLLGVEEPHHGVVLAGALVLIQEAGVWVETHEAADWRVSVGDVGRLAKMMKPDGKVSMSTSFQKDLVPSCWREGSYLQNQNYRPVGGTRPDGKFRLAVINSGVFGCLFTQ